MFDGTRSSEDTETISGNDNDYIVATERASSNADVANLVDNTSMGGEMLLLNVSDSASSQENEENAIEDIDPSVTDEEEEGSIISVNGTGLGLRTEVETSGENDTDQADSVKRDSS
jgi:hypothetical protein